MVLKYTSEKNSNKINIHDEINDKINNEINTHNAIVNIMRKIVFVKFLIFSKYKMKTISSFLLLYSSSMLKISNF
jgi:hypothetical protein